MLKCTFIGLLPHLPPKSLIDMFKVSIECSTADCSKRLIMIFNVFNDAGVNKIYCIMYLSGKSKEAEIKRINKELANIRSKFKGDKTLDGYQKKKYVCKLLFIFLLGHDIDFGHMEAVNLLSSNKYSEKQIVSINYFLYTKLL